MAKFFDESKWRAAITNPDWYIALCPELKTLRQRWENPNEPDGNAIKSKVRQFFESAMLADKLALANHGPNLDAERGPIDTIVIHHTSAKPGYRLSYMNAVQMLNVYVPYFNNPSESIPGEGKLKGSPLWSNHVRSGRPVFYLYHWLMRMDGTFERLLNDNELGWHAANWDINCRSAGICLDNDYNQRDPSAEVLRKLANFITQQYPQVPHARIFGHREVSKHSTTCPGRNFVGGWKQQLFELVRVV